MATELFSVWGFQTGWLSQHGDGYVASAELDGLDILYWSTLQGGSKGVQSCLSANIFCVDYSPGLHLPVLTWAQPQPTHTS